MLDNSLPYLIALVVMGSVFFLAVSLHGIFGGAQKVDRMRKRIGGDAGAPGLTAVHLASRKLNRLFGSLGEKLGPRDGEGWSKGRVAMLQAGIRNPNAHVIFQGVKAVLALALAGSFLLARMLLAPDMEMQWTLGIAIALALTGCYVPDIWLRSRTSGRKDQLMKELPDALDLLVVCVESGMGMDQALNRVSEEMRISAPGICEELRTVTLELRAGKRRQEALRSLAERVGLEDLSSLVTLLIQADVFGISVARTLRVYSDTLRTKRYQKAEELAAKLPVKMLIPLVTCILPALFVVIMGPAGIKLMNMFSQMNN